MSCLFFCCCFISYKVSRKDEYIPNVFSDDNEGKIIENIDYKYFNNRASFMGNPVILESEPARPSCERLSVGMLTRTGQNQYSDMSIYRQTDGTDRVIGK